MIIRISDALINEIHLSIGNIKFDNILSLG